MQEPYVLFRSDVVVLLECHLVQSIVVRGLQGGVEYKDGKGAGKVAL